MHGCIDLVQRKACAAKAQYFGVGSQDKKSTRAQGTLQNRAGYGAQWFFGLVTERGGTLETNEAENRQYQSQADT